MVGAGCTRVLETGVGVPRQLTGCLRWACMQGGGLGGCMPAPHDRMSEQAQHQGWAWVVVMCQLLHHRDMEVVQLLLDKGADVNAQGGYMGMHSVQHHLHTT